MRRFACHRTRSLRAAAIVVYGCLATQSTSAAERTAVANGADKGQIGTAFEPSPFESSIHTQFDVRLTSGKITREPTTPSAGCSSTSRRSCRPASELSWKRVRIEHLLGFEMGLLRDFSFTVDLPIIYKDHTQYAYADGVDGSSSTVDPEGGTQILPHDFEGFQKGLGPIAFGLRFAPLNDLRDDTKPTWLLAFRWEAPWTSPTFRPKRVTTARKPGTVGDGIHRLHFTMAFSKRIGNFGLVGIDPSLMRRGFVDPYLSLSYVMPVPQKSKVVRSLLDGVNASSNAASHRVEIAAGVEIVPHEDLQMGEKIAIDVGLRSTYNSEGRTYSIVADALDRLPYTEQNFEIEGVVGLHVYLNRRVRLHAGFGLGHTTEYFLTDEAQYFNDNQEPNPHFDPELDQIGRRLRNESQLLRHFFGGLTVTL